MTVQRLMLTVAVGALISSRSVLAEASSPAAVVPDAEIQKILAERVDSSRQSVVIVVGVIDLSGGRVLAHGKASTNDGARPLDGDAVGRHLLDAKSPLLSANSRTAVVLHQLGRDQRATRAN